MNMATKQEVLRAHLKRWLATKPYSKERRELREHLSHTLCIHTNSVGRAMRCVQMKRNTGVRRGRPKKYTKDVDAALYEIWDAMDKPCAEVLQPMVDTYIHAFVDERTWTYNDMVEPLLKSMSIGTIKQRISGWRTQAGDTRGYSATTPSNLKLMIPIRKSHTWTGLPPGHTQTDTVVHCGDHLTGDVVYSVGIVDFATYWSEYTAQWNKGEIATRESVATILEHFPFPITELHPDSGNEFINYHLKRWADTHGIAMTRSEQYKKNDNMCIEERNGSIARKHLGYARLDDECIVPIAAELLRISCMVHNHFRPVRRMIHKEWVGTKWCRTYEKVAKTPYQRVLDHSAVLDADKARLRAVHTNLNPLRIKRELDTLKTELYRKLAKKRAES